MSTELWQRIRAARKHAGATQQKIAEACGCDRAAVSLWESADPGKRSKPRNEHLKAVAAATGCPIDWLISDDSQIPAEWMRRDRWTLVMAEQLKGAGTEEAIRYLPSIDQVQAPVESFTVELLRLAFRLNENGRQALLSVAESLSLQTSLSLGAPR